MHIQIARAYYIKTMKGAMEVHKDHKAILECYEDRDLEALKREITTHIQRIRASVLEILDEGNPVM